MNHFVKASLAAALLTAPLMAEESFGGIGITIYQVPQGVHVVQVIPGTPAAETKIQAGDDIIAVDGVSLQGQDIEASKSMLRGQVNKPLEITYVSNGDTMSVVVRRAQMTVLGLDGQAVEAWYGDKTEFNVQELEAYASAAQNDKQLVAVLQKGNTIDNNASVSAAGLDGIYVEKTNEFAPKAAKSNVVRNADFSLRGFTREIISLNLKTSGTIILNVTNADGELVASLRKDNALAGVNSISWNGSNLPSGRYMISVEHNGSVSGKIAVLK